MILQRGQAFLRRINLGPSLPMIPVGTNPTRRRTACEAVLPGSVSASTAVTPGWPKAQRQASRTASVA